MINTITFVIICGSVAVGIAIYAWFFIFNKKDGVCDVMEERADGTLVVLKSNIPYRFKGRAPGQTDSMVIGNFKKCKPIDKQYAVSWLNKKCDKMYILRDSDGFFHPMKAFWDEKEKSLKIKPDYRDTIDWIVNDFDERDKIKEKTTGMDKFLQYAPPVMMMMLMVFGGVMWWQHEEKVATTYNGLTTTLDAKLEKAAQMYNPTLMQKAMQIVAQYEMERGTINWTQTIVQGTGIQVNS